MSTTFAQATGANAASRTPARKFALASSPSLLRQPVIPQPILEWLGDAVLTSDQTEQAARAHAIKKLQARYDQIRARIETMYMDKLDGRITEEFFDKQSATWRLEQDALLRKMQDVQKAAAAPIDQAIDMLRLTSCAGESFLEQPALEQRRLLRVLVETATWKGGALQTKMFEPFEILRHSNQESNRKEKEIAGSDAILKFGSVNGIRTNAVSVNPVRQRGDGISGTGVPRTVGSQFTPKSDNRVTTSGTCSAF